MGGSELRVAGARVLIYAAVPMKIARAIVLFVVLGCVALIAGHLLNLPGYPVWGWLAAPRYEKEAVFEVSGEALHPGTWASRWGRNRPEGERPHEIWSELEVRVRHETRSGAVVVSVVGDSEDEVDAFINTLKADVAHTYRKPDSVYGIRQSNALFHLARDVGGGAVYWRQRYLGVLFVNVILLGGVWFLMGRRGVASN